MRSTSLFAVVTLLAACLSGNAGDEKVPLDKLPAPVKNTIQKRFPNGEVTEAVKETASGKIVFEVMMKVKGQKIDVILTPEGQLQTIEKEITAKDLPMVVREALAAKYPQAAYKKYEEIIKVKGDLEKLEYYEVILDAGDKKDLEVEITADGKFKK